MLPLRSKSAITLILCTAFLCANCKDSDEPIPDSEYKLEDCTQPEGLVSFKQVKAVAGTVRGYKINATNPGFDGYLIEFPDAPAGHLAPCNLPSDLRADGLKITFSGDIYVPLNLETVNLNAVPVELSGVHKVD